MPAAPLPSNETARLAAVHRLGMMDSGPNDEFDALARVAALVCGTEFALISVIDSDRQWMSACVGMPGLTETPRSVALCSYTILSDDLLEVADLTLDERFSDNPFVTGGPCIRFYAGMPVCMRDGSRVGTICVIDCTPRALTALQRSALRSLATAAAFAMEGWRARAVQAQLTERLGFATTGCGIGIWDWDIVANRMDWDAMTYQLHGATLGSDVATVDLWYRHIHPDDRATAERSLEHVLANLNRFHAEFRVVWPDGSIRHIHSAGVVRRDASGHAVRMLGSNWDVTARVEAQDALRVSEERLRQLLDSLTDHAVSLLDAAGNVASWHPAAARINGYDAEEIIGQPFSTFFVDQDGTEATEGTAARALALATEQGRFQDEGWRVSKNGKRFWARTSLSAVRDAKGELRGFAEVLQDLSEQRLAQEQQKILIEAAPNAMLIVDEAGIIALANAQAEMIFGYAPGTLKGQPSDILLPSDEIERRRLARLSWASQPNLRTLPQYDFNALRKDGSVFPMEALLRPVHTQHGLVTVASLFDATERLNQQRARDAREAAERAAAEAVKQRLEQLARHLGRARDQAQRANEAKSRFLAAISHELRTPLNGILGYAQLLRLEGGLRPHQAEQVDEMLSAGEHLLGMINAVLDLSQIESDRLELQPVLIDIAGFTHKCLSVLRPAAAAKSLKLSLMIAPDAPIELVADPTRLRQVLVNLLGNAVKFTKSGGAELRVLQAQATADRIRVEVADTGPGIPDLQRERLFREFSRLGTDDAVTIEGTGLGLAITARLVQRMGGQVGYSDNPGGGSVFWFELPVGDVSAAASAVVVAQAKVAGLAQALRILVVDDVDMNRKIAKAFLALGGHHVECAESGEAAVKAVSAGDFDVVMMDVQMPGIDGLEATRRIRQLPGPRGQVLVMAMTAQAFANQIDDCMASGMNGHVSKPLEHASLLAAVTQAYANRSATPLPQLPTDKPEPPLLDEMSFRATSQILAPEDVKEYLAILITRGRALLEALESPNLGANANEIALTVHALRGSAGTFGFRRLDTVATEFERIVETVAPGIDDSALHLVKTLRDTLDLLETLTCQGSGVSVDADRMTAA
jgi:PAS domain S-box-containing protein